MLTHDRFDDIHGTITTQFDYKLAADTVCYVGGIYVPNDDGLLVRPDTAPATPRRCVLALASGDNTGGIDGAVTVRCAVRTTAFLAKGSLNQADVGRTVYATGDNILTTTENTRRVGELIAIDREYAVVVL